MGLVCISVVVLTTSQATSSTRSISAAITLLSLDNIIIDYSLKKQKKFSDIVSLMHITNWNDSEKKALLDKIFENIIKNFFRVVTLLVLK